MNVEPPTGPISPLQKKPVNGIAFTLSPEHIGVVVGPTVEVRAAPKTREEQGSSLFVEGRLGGVPGQHRVQVQRRCLGVSQVELDGLSLPEHLGHGQNPLFVVGSHEVAYQEIPQLRVLVERVHHHTEEEGVPGQLLVSLVEAAEDASQHLEGLLPVELVQDVAVAGRHLHRLSDGPASLGHDSVDLDIAVERDTNRTR